MMAPLELDSSNPRGHEGFFASPPLTANARSFGAGDAATHFRSPKPSKTSNIRVVTRIRPLLPRELDVGATPQIIPIPSTATTLQNNDSLPAQSQNDGRALSPRNNFPTANSNIRHHKSLLPPKSTSSLLPPPSKASSFLTPSSRQSHTPPSISSTSLHANDDRTNSKKQFDFDCCLGMEATQEQVYAAAVGDKILTNVFRGINVTVLAYGITCSGKSHTMQGYTNEGTTTNLDDDSENQCPNSPSNNIHNHSFCIAEHDGIIPRAIYDLFRGKMEYRSSGKGDVAVDLIFYELYNDGIRDLLADDDDFRPLRLIDQGEDMGGVIIEGLTTIPVYSAEQAHQLITYATQRRATSSTNLNVQSSRSHSICNLTVRTTPFGGKISSSSSSGSEITQAKLTLVDLAGSERLKRSGVVGAQQQESITINKDLFVLGKVVSALADKSRSGKQTHVPFRDSKLTRLLRESLGGNCFTVMVACVSPAAKDMEESINTLRYAERARSISNSIKRNISQALLNPQECAALASENMRLKQLVLKLKKRVEAEISRDRAGSLLDLEEETINGPSTTNIHVPANGREIFRVPSQSSASLQSSSSIEESVSRPNREERKDKPIWLHFKDLAKITKNVSFPAVETKTENPESSEIELGDRSPRNSADNGDNQLSKPGDRDKRNGAADRETTTARLQDETGSLQKEIAELKAEHARVELLLRQSQEDLERASKDASASEASVQALEQEHLLLKKTVDDKRSELVELNEKSQQEQNEDLARRDNLRQEVVYLERFLEQLTQNISQLDISSPQRSFSRIVAAAENYQFDETEGEGLNDMATAGDSETSLQSWFLNLQGKFSKLELQLREDQQQKQSNQRSVEASANDAKLYELKATVDTQKQRIIELESKLAHATEQQRISDLAKSASDSQVTSLEKRIQEVESELSTVSQTTKGEKERLTSSYEGKIAALEAAIKEEREQRRNIEEAHNFLHLDYESLSNCLQQKVSDLKDQANQEKGKRKDFEYQVQVLRKTTSELEGTLKDKTRQHNVEKIRYTKLQYKVLALEAANHAAVHKHTKLEEMLAARTQQHDDEKARNMERIKTLEAAYHAAADKQKQLEETLMARNEQHEAEKASNMEQIKTLETAVDKVKQFGELLKDKTSRNLELQHEIKVEKARNMELENHIKAIQNENHAQNIDLHALSKQSSWAKAKELTQETKTLAILTEIASGSDLGDESPQSASSNVSQQPDFIRMKASKVLQLADAAISAMDGKSITSTSCCSSAGTEFRPPVSDDAQRAHPCLDHHPSETDGTSPKTMESSPKIEITNLSEMEKQCKCSSTLFAQNAEYVEFYLPRISIECTCGRKSATEKVEESQTDKDPCDLQAILREWQLDFLKHVGITDAMSLVHACNHRGGALAAEMRKWRRQNGLSSIRTKSCGVALHIWSRTASGVIRSVRSQKENGILVPKRPEFLELNIAENNTAVSSLGGGPFHSKK